MDDRLDPKQRIAGEAPIYAAAALLCALCLALAASRGIFFGIDGVVSNAGIFLASVAVMLIGDLSIQLYRYRPPSPLTFALARYGSRTNRTRMLAALPLAIVCVVLMPFFSAFKAMIPLFNNYSWDATFIALDRALFFGRDAWEVFQPLLGFPAVTALLAFFYHLWMLLLYPGVIFMAWYGIDRDIRRRFFLSYVLAWSFVGGLVATIFASVGPCFLAPIMSDNSFAAQMAYLEAANSQFPIMTLDVQHMLLDRYHEGANGLGSGITAMPSMHIAIAFLYWLTMRHVSKAAGRFFLGFMVIIWIGSVHLAYHYFVDGLVSIICVAALWKASARILRWWDQRLTQPQLTEALPA
ncbi:MAG: phosphatase PAP2 family protein [Rhodobiaceae bacterium]|nr:phosphatase PAP2 family protein [Novosphingobium sp.]MCC0011791.1 phosphatase PAP2 family protein [Rhodobiaceae bacterium]MCP5388719.1 phosphatase PAP2 family protein [Novosphingobium sp.]